MAYVLVRAHIDAENSGTVDKYVVNINTTINTGE